LLLLIILDQTIKVLSPLQLPNRGVAFALFPDSGLLLALAGAALMAGLTWHFRRDLPLRVPLVLLWAGTVSNLLDRITKGAVIDVFYLGPLSVNLADFLLIAGTAMVVLRKRQTPGKPL
jgi:lipoprotein signal peptidase